MDRNGIDMSVAMPLFGDWEKDYMPQNKYIADAQKEYPNRIIGFCWLIPKLGQQALKDLDTCINDLEL